MAHEDMVRLGEAMEKKWNEEHPGVEMPDVNSKEFDAFCDEFLSANKSISDNKKMEAESQKESENVYEDDKYRYTKVDKNYIRHAINNWIDANPGKSIGLVLVAGAILSCKVFQHICKKAVYKGNIRAYRYLIKHVK